MPAWASGAWAVGAWAGTAWADAGVTVPDVVGDTQANATAALEGAGFVVSVQEQYSNSVAVGLVIGQQPSGGAEVPAGSVVVIVVSLGDEPVSENKGAGRRKRRKRYLVEIDGQDFEVSSLGEAEALLDRAKEVAAKAIEKASQAPTRIAPGRPGISRPVIRTAAPELRAAIQRASQEIGALYDSARRDLEIAALMAKQIEDEEEEALIRLLM